MILSIDFHVILKVLEFKVQSGHLTFARRVALLYLMWMPIVEETNEIFRLSLRPKRVITPVAISVVSIDKLFVAFPSNLSKVLSMYVHTP